MYLTDYPWTLCVTHKQFRVIRKLLRGDALLQHEEEVADKMSGTMEHVYLQKMDAKQARQEQWNTNQNQNPDQRPHQSPDD